MAKEARNTTALGGGSSGGGGGGYNNGGGISSYAPEGGHSKFDGVSTFLHKNQRLPLPFLRDDIGSETREARRGKRRGRASRVSDPREAHIFIFDLSVWCAITKYIAHQTRPWCFVCGAKDFCAPATMWLLLPLRVTALRMHKMTRSNEILQRVFAFQNQMAQDTYSDFR